jgi:hypothetical protein
VRDKVAEMLEKTTFADLAQGQKQLDTKADHPGPTTQGPQPKEPGSTA